MIGNPPWREYSQVRDTYTIRGYHTERCNNLHAFCTERALALRAAGGYASFIIQLPMVSAKRMAPVRAELRRRSSRLWIATFDDRPGKLFDGLENCRSTIFLSRGGSSSERPQLAVTGYQRWTTAERPLLFGRLRFAELDEVPLFDGLFPKVQTSAQARVFAKLAKDADATIASYTRRSATPHFVFYQESARYWVKATTGLPYYGSSCIHVGRATGMRPQTRVIMARRDSSRRKPRARWLRSRTVEFIPSNLALVRPRVMAFAIWWRWVSKVTAMRMNGSSSLRHAARTHSSSSRIASA